MADTLHSTEKVSVAALMGVILRRKLSRTIDIKWLVENEVYAKNIIALSREQGLADLDKYTDQFEMLMFGKSKITPPVLENQHFIKVDISSNKQSTISSDENEFDDIDEVESSNKYIGGLR